jgi:hypothetical protein
MNHKPIQEARNADLRGSWPALQRAAQRARELAAQTGTELVIIRHGAMVRIKPHASLSDTVNEPPESYGNPS